MFKSNFVLERNMLLRIALIRHSRHWCIYLKAMLSRFSQTQVIERSTTAVKCQDIFEMKNLLIKEQFVSGGALAVHQYLT